MIVRAPFGSTGHESTRAIFGAAALARVSENDADRALETLLSHGVNHIDVAAGYGDAELRVANWLRRNPGTFFLATKTGERTYRDAREQIRRSLDRLGVDRIDLIQLHNLVDVIEWETALGANGALKAAVEARDEGLVRFIGVTGHGYSAPEMHRRSLERFPFDSVLAPCNYVQMRDQGYAQRFEALAAVCAARNVALQTIKSLARRPWDGRTATAATWYEPLTEQADIDLSAHWVLGRPDVFLLTSGDVEILPRLLDAVERFERRPSDQQMDEFAARSEATPLFVETGTTDRGAPAADGVPRPFLAEPRCAVCGHKATHVELIEPGGRPEDWERRTPEGRQYFLDAVARHDPPPWWLVVRGIEAGNGLGGAVDHARAALLTRAFTSPLRYAAVHTADFYDDAGFCGPCDAAYCDTHWHVSTTGFGRCPHGHGKSLDPFWTSRIDDD